MFEYYYRRVEVSYNSTSAELTMRRVASQMRWQCASTSFGVSERRCWVRVARSYYIPFDLEKEKTRHDAIIVSRFSKDEPLNGQKSRNPEVQKATQRLASLISRTEKSSKPNNSTSIGSAVDCSLDCSALPIFYAKRSLRSRVLTRTFVWIGKFGARSRQKQRERETIV